MKPCKETGYLFYSHDSLILMINILYSERKDKDLESIPWDYIAILFEDLDDPPMA